MSEIGYVTEAKIKKAQQPLLNFKPSEILQKSVYQPY